jgi:hypothetical protein
MAVYREADTVVGVKHYKAPLPEDFSLLHAAYKCSPYVEAGDIAHLQGDPVSLYSDVTWELLRGSEGMEVEVVINPDERIIQKITTRQYIKTEQLTVNFKNPVLLTLSPNVKDRATEDCENLFCSSPFEISIRDGYIYKNFTNDCIYLNYYAFPKDEQGLPMIPDIEKVEKAIEWHMISEISRMLWFNSSAPDMQVRWQSAEKEAAFWLDQARAERKMPTFKEMVNTTKRRRVVNKIFLFAK